VDNEYKKQEQFFENNSNLRQLLETRRSRAERNAGLAKSNYVKAAREAEPLLQQIRPGSVRPETPVDEEGVRNMMKSELKSFVQFRDLDAEVENLRRKMQKDVEDDIRARLRFLSTKYDYDRLAERIQTLEILPQKVNVSGNPVSFGPEFEQFKTDMATRMAKHTLELSELGRRISVAEMELTGLSSNPTQPNKNISQEDFTQVYLFKVLVANDRCEVLLRKLKRF